ncbi:MAG: penicillin-binding transpeptidase domain-containing protein, partial [Thermoleophilia bacterium]
PRRELDIAPDTRDTILSGLQSAAMEPGGTSYPVFGGFPVEVAGKTGTAEVGANREFTQPWFIAFAPVENPRMAIAVTVERTTGEGGTVAAPIAKTVLEAMLGGGG